MESDVKGRSSSVLYIPHGGGPLPLLGDPGHRTMVEFLQRITLHIPVPEAIVVISAHWEERKPTITGGQSPSLIYDYSGFPEESYHLQYPAPGDPALAERIFGLLKEEGIDARVDGQRGFDHGMYVPLKIIYPDAMIPTVQLSLVRGLDPATHLRLGEALRGLSQEKLLILGSGFSFHNLSAFFSPGQSALDARNASFQDWLVETCTSQGIAQSDRERRLVEWEQAPSARYCHPREEHLLPLHVCCGLAGSPAQLVFDGEVLGKRAIGLLWKVQVVDATGKN